jgi:hypothetical protein
MTARRLPTKRAALAVVALAAVTTTAVACSDKGTNAGGGPAVPVTKSGPTTSTTAVPKLASPLTGLPVDADVARRPIVMVKVDNSDPGRNAQTGIDKADVLVEEKVEGTVTRFIAMFQSEDSDLVGPIRSVRTTDASIISAFPGSVFTYAGGAGKAVASLKGTPVTKVSEEEGSGPFTYPPGHRRPYALFAKTKRLREEADDTAAAPPAMLPFLAEGEAFASPHATPATKATVVFGSLTTATLQWDAASSTWLRTTNGRAHTIQNGHQLAFKTVIVQLVPYRNVGYLDSAKNKVDEAVVVGSGNAVVLVNGMQLKARWSKPTARSMTTYTDEAGTPIRFPQGQTLVMLPPTGASVTVV